MHSIWERLKHNKLCDLDIKRRHLIQSYHKCLADMKSHQMYKLSTFAEYERDAYVVVYRSRIKEFKSKELYKQRHVENMIERLWGVSEDVYNDLVVEKGLWDPLVDFIEEQFWCENCRSMQMVRMRHYHDCGPSESYDPEIGDTSFECNW